MPGFSHFLGNRTINFRMFFAPLVFASCIKDTCSNLSPSKELVKGDEIVRPLDRHSNETTTVGKHFTKYKHTRKFMLVFLDKFENRGIKIARVNWIQITKSINLFKFFMVLGVHCDVDIFKIIAHAQSINSESLCTILC